MAPKTARIAEPRAAQPAVFNYLSSMRPTADRATRWCQHVLASRSRPVDTIRTPACFSVHPARCLNAADDFDHGFQ